VNKRFKEVEVIFTPISQIEFIGRPRDRPLQYTHVWREAWPAFRLSTSVISVVPIFAASPTMSFFFRFVSGCGHMEEIVNVSKVDGNRLSLKYVKFNLEYLHLETDCRIGHCNARMLCVKPTLAFPCLPSEFSSVPTHSASPKKPFSLYFSSFFESE